MSPSLTATATTVAAQRLLATHRWSTADSSLKQLTLRLDFPSQTAPPTAMARSLIRPTPISRLPVELLSHIFILCAHSPDDEEEAASADADAFLSEHDNSDDISPCLLSSATSPDVFAAVNRHWREVAIATPQLWTRICVTIGDVMHSQRTNFAPVSRYASRSSKCPLDIFIDARDPEWDFSETDGAVVSPYYDELHDYVHPFKVEHMHHVLNILLPHLQRIRSLVILTDRWAPMQTALDCLSMEDPSLVSLPHPLPPTLPRLESLVLMRCNEFVSYHSEFSPTDGRDAAALPFSALLPPAHAPVLPRLKKLVLSGVHTQWSALPRLLAPPQHHPAASALETLELSYHCNEVRPSARDFKALLARCPRLRTLTVRVSGPKSPVRACRTATADTAHSNSPTPTAAAARAEDEPVALPRLETVVLGYDDPRTAATALRALDAPAVRTLVLENAASPAREDTPDAEPLLGACTAPRPLPSSSSSSPSSSSSRPSHPSPSLGGHRPPLVPRFPRVESLTLHKVEAPAEAFEALFAALPRLRALAVSQMFLLGGRALAPDVRVTFVPVPERDERDEPEWGVCKMAGAAGAGGLVGEL